MSYCVMIADLQRDGMDLELVGSLLQEVPSLVAFSKGKGVDGAGVVTANYAYERQELYVEVRESSPTICVHGSRATSLVFAVEFAKRYCCGDRGPLRVFDVSYNFDQYVDSNTTLGWLKEQIETNPFAAQGEDDKTSGQSE
jgi:hypothetical protein